MIGKLNIIPLCLLSALATAPAAQETEPQPLDLKTAIQLALQHHPGVREAKHQMEAAEGEARQMALLPNPDIYLEAETLGSDKLIDRSEVIFGLSQAIPIGGRTLRAGRIGDLETQRMREAQSLAMLELKKTVTNRFVDALYYQESLQLQMQIADATEQHAILAAARHKQGEIIQSETAQAEIEYMREKAKAEETQVLLTNALDSLAVAVGRKGMEIPSVVGNLEELFALPLVEDLQSPINSNPLVREGKLAVEIERAIESKLKSELIPDLDLDVGYRRLREIGENTFDVGISISIPIFDRNQGAIAAAQARQRAAESRLELTRTALRERIDSEKRLLSRQRKHLVLIRDDILPRARQVLETAEFRYESGDINMLEALVARRQAARYQLDYLDALRRVHYTAAALQATLGKEDY